MVRSFDEIVDSPLPEQVGLCLLRRTSLSIGRPLIHPVDFVYALLPTRSFQLPLQLFLGALFLDLIDAVLGALALGEGLLFFIVDGRLVLAKCRMERLFEVEVAAAHFAGVGYR